MRRIAAIISIILMSNLTTYSHNIRLVSAEKKLWILNEDTYSLSIVNKQAEWPNCGSYVRVSEFGFLGQNNDSGSFLAYESVKNGYSTTSIERLDQKKITFNCSGQFSAYSSSNGLLAFLELNPKTIEDALFVCDISSGDRYLIASGGFFEKFPIVQTRNSFYVFNSDENRTLRVRILDGKVVIEPDYPLFLNKKVVIAVSSDESLYLVLDRDNGGQYILDSQGEKISKLNLNSGDQAIEFSSDTNSIYVSRVRISAQVEVRDLVNYNIKTRAIDHVIKKGIRVGLGQITRNGIIYSEYGRLIPTTPSESAPAKTPKEEKE